MLHVFSSVCQESVHWPTKCRLCVRVITVTRALCTCQACFKAALSHSAINNAASESGLPVWTKSSQGRASLFITRILRLKSLLKSFVKVQMVLDSPPLISLMVSVDVNHHERRKSCVKVEVAVLGSPPVISLMVSVNVKHR